MKWGGSIQPSYLHGKGEVEAVEDGYPEKNSINLHHEPGCFGVTPGSVAEE
jgi:hypothetical protein